MGSLATQLKKLEKSPKFQQKVAQAQKEALKRRKSFGQGPGVISQEKAMERAEEMREILFQKVSAVIPSIERSDIEIGLPRLDENGNYSIDIWFDRDKLYRPSMTGKGGVDNIVLLFTTGYSASAQVYGVWHGEWYASRTQLDGDDFMQKAVEEFNRRNRDAQAELNEQYYA